MHLIIKFKNNGFLYYYLLFLFVIGSCTYGGGSSEISKEGDMEEIEEKPDEKKDSDTIIADKSIDIPDEDSELHDMFDISDDDIILLDNDSEFPDDSLPDISGRWVKLMIFSGRAKPPLIDPPEAWAVMVIKVDMEQNGTDLLSYNEMCRLKVGINSAVLSPIIPDTFAKALPIVEKQGSISVNDNGEVLFYQPKIWEVRSCHLDDPENDPLPTKENAPNVFDPDNTGKNGLKMFSSGLVNGEAEVVQKVSTELNGFIDEEGNIRGIVKWFEDQKVLWTDQTLMRNGAPTYPDGNPDNSIFIYKRVDTSWDCDMIREKSAELFPEQAKKYPGEFK